MPAQKLSYKVDVDTGTAVRDLARLGTAGADAGRDIAQGFDQAETASSAALKALSAQLDTVEQDAKGTAQAVAAIKAHLTVDVDDAKIGQFATDLKNKLGVAFEDVERDAREFAAVLERGVDLSNTTNEIRGVGTALDHTRGSADQSRSVLANLAGNTAQDLGQLGGVVGSLGVGVGQLAEYAVDGNIKLSNLAGLAGPMAALAVAGAGVQSVMSNIAETKAFDVEQVKAMSAAFGELGDTSTALAASMDGVFNARIDNGSLWGQLTGAQKTKDLAADLAAVGVTLGDIDRIIRSGAADRASFEMLPDVQNLDAILQAAGLSVDQYEAIMDGVFETTKNWTTATDGAGKAAEFFGSTLSTVNQAIKAQLLEDDPFAAFNFGLFQTGGHLHDLQAIWNDVVTDMRDDDASFDTTAHNVDVLAEAMGLTTDEVIALARETGQAAKSQGELQLKTVAATEAADAQAESVRGTVDALQALIDKQNDMLSATDDLADAQQAWDDGLADLPGTIAETTAAMDGATAGSPEWTAAMRDQRDTLTGLVDQYVQATELQATSNGQQLTATQRVDAQARALGQLAGTLDSRTIPAVADYYASIFKIPEDRKTEFELVLLSGDQAAIEQFVAENSGTKTLAINAEADAAKLAKVNRDVSAVTGPRTAPVTAVAYTSAARSNLDGLTGPMSVKVGADTSSADATMAAWRKTQASVAVHVPIRAGVTSATHASESASTLAATSSPTVSAVAAPAPAVSAGAGLVPFVVQAAPSIVVNLSAGVVGNRYDLSRWVRAATRDQQRLGRMATVTPS